MRRNFAWLLCSAAIAISAAASVDRPTGYQFAISDVDPAGSAAVADARIAAIVSAGATSVVGYAPAGCAKNGSTGSSGEYAVPLSAADFGPEFANGTVVVVTHVSVVLVTYHPGGLTASVAVVAYAADPYDNITLAGPTGNPGQFVAALGEPGYSEAVATTAAVSSGNSTAIAESTFHTGDQYDLGVLVGNGTRVWIGVRIDECAYSAGLSIPWAKIPTVTASGPSRVRKNWTSPGGWFSDWNSPIWRKNIAPNNVLIFVFGVRYSGPRPRSDSPPPSPADSPPTSPSDSPMSGGLASESRSSPETIVAQSPSGGSPEGSDIADPSGGSSGAIAGGSSAGSPYSAKVFGLAVGGVVIGLAALGGVVWLAVCVARRRRRRRAVLERPRPAAREMKAMGFGKRQPDTSPTELRISESGAPSTGRRSVLATGAMAESKLGRSTADLAGAASSSASAAAGRTDSAGGGSRATRRGRDKERGVPAPPPGRVLEMKVEGQGGRLAMVSLAGIEAAVRGNTSVPFESLATIYPHQVEVWRGRLEVGDASNGIATFGIRNSDPEGRRIEYVIRCPDDRQVIATAFDVGVGGVWGEDGSVLEPGHTLDEDIFKLPKEDRGAAGSVSGELDPGDSAVFVAYVVAKMNTTKVPYVEVCVGTVKRGAARAAFKRFMNPRRPDAHGSEFRYEFSAKLVSMSVVVCPGPDIRLDPDDIVKHEKIGAGAYGTVYRATWKRMQVAVKDMFGEIGGDGQSAAVRGELMLHSGLRGPYVVQLIGFYSVGPRVSLVTEFAPLGSVDKLLARARAGKPLVASPDERRSDGAECAPTTLGSGCRIAAAGSDAPADLLPQGKPIAMRTQADLEEERRIAQESRRVMNRVRFEGIAPLAMRTRFALDISRGMEYLHGLSVVHRDLKPGNVLVTSLAFSDQAPCCKITDFGTAKAMSADAALSCDAGRYATKFVGTAAFMAPEIMDGKIGCYSERSDVYAYAITLHSVIVGEEPYATLENNIEIAKATLAGSRMSVAEFRDLVGDEVTRMLEDCWAQSPEVRRPFSEISRVMEAATKVATRRQRSSPRESPTPVRPQDAPGATSSGGGSPARSSDPLLESVTTKTI